MRYAGSQVKIKATRKCTVLQGFLIQMDSLRTEDLQKIQEQLADTDRVRPIHVVLTERPEACATAILLVESR